MDLQEEEVATPGAISSNEVTMITQPGPLRDTKGRQDVACNNAVARKAAREVSTAVLVKCSRATCDQGQGGSRCNVRPLRF